MKTFYLDMDGVVADFVVAACTFFQRPHPMDEFGVTDWNFFVTQWKMPWNTFWDPLDNNFEFWANIPVKPDLIRIKMAIEDSVGWENVVICTHPSFSSGCIQGKMSWIHKHMKEVGNRIVFTKDKSVVAHEKSLLLDDLEDNVNRFRARGGKAILFPENYNQRDSERSTWNVEQEIAASWSLL